jgi:glycine/D-amino acid oxidase-like deaminating enzyme
MDDLPVPGRQRSWWLREALAVEGDPSPAPALARDTDADVVIVGGGYTGMWTAYFVHEREPDARIVLLEQDICGGGPSGRNGGFVHGWWENVGYLTERFGPDAALEIAREADEVVEGIGKWCNKHRVDAHYVKAGYLRVNAFPNEPPDWEEAVERLRAAGVGDQLEPVDAEANLRLPGVPGRSSHAERGLGPARPARQGPPASPAQAWRADLRGHLRRVGLA